MRHKSSKGIAGIKRSVNSGKLKCCQKSAKRRALLIIIVVLGLLVVLSYSLGLFSNRLPKNDEATLIDKLTCTSSAATEIGFLDGDKVLTNKLNDLANMDYSSIKKALDIKKDFVMYFEDEQGNLIPVSGKLCLGSPRASVQGVECG